MKILSTNGERVWASAELKALLVRLRWLANDLKRDMKGMGAK